MSVCSDEQQLGLAEQLNLIGDLRAMLEPGPGGKGESTGAPDRAGHDGAAAPVVVKLLGPIEISGMARPFTRAWATDLVVYLSMHRRGCSNEDWATALWPDKQMAPSTLHSTASAARRALGFDQAGLDHLPCSHGRLRLRATVETDWEQFMTLSESDLHVDDCRALDLVRGRPFAEGLRELDWVIGRGFQSEMEEAITIVACRTGERCLQGGDPAGAIRAARQGLSASPYDERLHRLLMSAADAAGNPAGVESAFCELISLLGGGGDPAEIVHPITWNTYSSLSRRGQLVG
jgi:DNA-binding SARP family transcriptional activator